MAKKPSVAETLSSNVGKVDRSRRTYQRYAVDKMSGGEAADSYTNWAAKQKPKGK